VPLPEQGRQPRVRIGSTADHVVGDGSTALSRDISAVTRWTSPVVRRSGACGSGPSNPAVRWIVARSGRKEALPVPATVIYIVRA
jgi:hypothetical protein